jgi:hypothetical protein
VHVLDKVLGDMRIYHYSPATGELLYDSEAQPSPLEPGKFLIPASATDQVPQKAGAQEIAVFTNGEWTLQPDFREQIFYRKADGVDVVITAIGPVLNDLTSLKRPSVLHAWTGSEWAFSMELALTAIRIRRNELLSACDWTQLGDVALTTEQKAGWKAYRQALRDFPNNCNPESPIWPQQPE